MTQPTDTLPLPPGLHPDTLAVRTTIPRSGYGEHSEALYLTSCFVQPDSETSARNFASPDEGYTYSRTGNPSVTAFEQRLAALEGAQRALATASGMSAILLLGLALLKQGDHVICSRSMFGSTMRLFGTDFARFGVQTSFVSQTDPAAWQAAVRPNTRLLFAETPTNPLTEVCDIAALAAIAHQAGALLVVDNCFATPVLQRPLALGADLVVHSGTKFLDGQGRVMAGAVCGSGELIGQLSPVARAAGLTLSPFNAWVVHKGLETLSLRVRAQSEAALQLARWLESQPAVERVYYPGLPSHEHHELAKRQMRGFGGVVSICLKNDSREAVNTVIKNLHTVQLSSSLGGVESLVNHCYSQSHSGMAHDLKIALGIKIGLLRFSVGIEDIDDIYADIDQALRATL